MQTNNILAPLSHFGLLKVSGPDTQTFLQGQLTCDMQEVTTNNSCLGAYCNQQGRIIAAFRIFQYSEAYYLRMPKAIVDPTLDKLNQYALFSKVKLQNATDELLGIGVTGVKSLAHENSIVMPIGHARFECYGPAAAIQQLIEKLDLPMLDPWVWQLLDIRSGIPNIYLETQEKFLPHRINYHLINGINFNKGCYLGQEIIARMQYRGKLKHHMYRVASEHALKPGDSFKDIGQVVDCCKADKHYEALVVLQEGAVKGLDLLDLPYSNP